MITQLTTLRRVACADCGAVTETTLRCADCGSGAVEPFRGILASAKGYRSLLDDPRGPELAFYRPPRPVYPKRGILRRMLKLEGIA